MSNRPGFMSRARLIQTALATGALAACGGRLSPTPIGAGGLDLGSANSGDRFGLDAVLANDLFKNLDKQEILDRYDFSPKIAAIVRQLAEHGDAQVLPHGTVITSIPDTGYVITTPGTYTLGKDVMWTPSAKALGPAIIIASSNVTLNLAKHTLSLAASAKAGGSYVGVAVAPLSGTLQKVAISNGTIANFTLYGIVGAKVSGLTISGITVTGLRLRADLKSAKSRLLIPAGITTLGASNVAVSDCVVTKTNVTADVASGILLAQTAGGTVTDCSISSTVNNDGSAQGFSYLGSSGIKTTGCKANSLTTYFNGNVETPGHTCIGYVPTLSHDLTFTNCSADGMTGCCDDAHAFSVFMCWNTTVSHFTGSNVLDGAGKEKTGAKSTGLEVYSFGNVTVSDCTVSNIKAINPQDLQAAGFSAWGMTTTFERCTAINVSVVNNPKMADVRGIGFGWAPDPRGRFRDVAAFVTTYDHCTADTCDVGFDTWNHLNSTWTKTATKNIAKANQYLYQPNATRTIWCNGCSECKAGIRAKITNLADSSDTLDGKPFTA